ncbi:hypothetical protein [Streptomyces sp. SYSU K21746]
MRRPGRPAGPQHRHALPVTDPGSPKGRPQQRKQVLLRLDPLVYEALARWAGEELRSANAQIEFVLRRALAESGRLPGGTGPIPRRGRPPRAVARDAAPEAAPEADPRTES